MKWLLMLLIVGCEEYSLEGMRCGIVWEKNITDDGLRYFNINFPTDTTVVVDSFTYENAKVGITRFCY